MNKGYWELHAHVHDLAMEGYSVDSTTDSLFDAGYRKVTADDARQLQIAERQLAGAELDTTWLQDFIRRVTEGRHE